MRSTATTEHFSSDRVEFEFDQKSDSHHCGQGPHQSTTRNDIRPGCQYRQHRQPPRAWHQRRGIRRIQAHQTLEKHVINGVNVDAVELLAQTIAQAFKDPAQPNKFPNSFALAKATASDPWQFDTFSDGLGIDFLLNEAEIGVTPGFAFAASTITAESEVPGYEFLFSLLFNATIPGGSPLLGIDFTSNPLLGFDDAAIEALIRVCFISAPGRVTGA